MSRVRDRNNNALIKLGHRYNGEFILTGSNDQTIRIWDPDTGECVRTLEGHDDLVRTMCLDTIRRKVYSGSYDKT